MGPKMPPALSAPATTGYKAADFNADIGSYRARVAANDVQGALALRNQIAYRVMGDIEVSYSKFEMRLTTQRAGFETGSDALQLGMSAAATLVGATDIKNILDASLTAFQGTRTSFDKNFFQQKTTESIISQMRAARKTKQAEIITSLGTRDVASYPWDAVWIDLVDFYYAGTVPSALVGIASSTGASAEAATARLNEAVASLTPCTPTQAKQFVTVRSAYAKLDAAVNGQDSAKSASAIESLRAILTAAGVTPDAGGKGADLLAQLRKAITSATCGEALKALDAAVAKAALE